jgi:amidohydrolase
VRVHADELEQEIDRRVKDLEDELISVRRDLRAHPELSRHEMRTTALLVERLTAAGLSPRVLPTGTGVVCDVLDAAGTAPTIAFRGDIDALPLDDTTTTSYRSRTPGVCHACGHDAHTTVVLGTGLVLADLAARGLLTRSARLLFQPAEEVIPGGALDIIAAGEAEGLRRIFAFHCDPKLEVGTIGLRPGAITAGADGVKVTVFGPGGHTARPHLTSDVVYALACLVTELPGVLSRTTDPRAGLSVVWGRIQAGTAANAIPQRGEVEGTIRCLDVDVWEAAHARFPDLVRTLLLPFGVDVEIEAHTSVPPCVNDPRAIDEARSVVERVVGKAGAVSIDQSLGGEDFAWLTGVVPGALLRLGVRPTGVPDAGDLHQGGFDLDEAAIAVGVRTFARLALDD